MPNLPPTALASEQIVIGALLAPSFDLEGWPEPPVNLPEATGSELPSPFLTEAESDGLHLLRSEHFADPVHAAVYTAIAAHAGERPRFDLHAIVDEAAQRQPEVESVGGVSYLRACIEVGRDGTRDQVLGAARAVREAALWRSMLEVAERLHRIARGLQRECFGAGDSVLPSFSATTYRHLLRHEIREVADSLGK